MRSEGSAQLLEEKSDMLGVAAGEDSGDDVSVHDHGMDEVFIRV